MVTEGVETVLADGVCIFENSSLILLEMSDDV